MAIIRQRGHNLFKQHEEEDEQNALEEQASEPIGA
jgi:hypothetical protein